MQPQLSNGDKTAYLKPLHFNNGDFSFFFLYLDGSEKQALLQKMNLHKFHSYTHTNTRHTEHDSKSFEKWPSAKVINLNIWLLDVGVAYQQHRLERKKKKLSYKERQVDRMGTAHQMNLFCSYRHIISYTHKHMWVHRGNSANTQNIRTSPEVVLCVYTLLYIVYAHLRMCTISTCVCSCRTLSRCPVLIQSTCVALCFFFSGSALLI